MTRKLISVALLLCSCGYFEADECAPGYQGAAPLAAPDAGTPPDAGALGVVPGTGGAGSLANCASACPGALAVDFYAPFAFCECTCPSGVPVTANLRSPAELEALRAFWAALPGCR